MTSFLVFLDCVLQTSSNFGTNFFFASIMNFVTRQSVWLYHVFQRFYVHVHLAFVIRLHERNAFRMNISFLLRVQMETSTTPLGLAVAHHSVRRLKR
jgi:hypothetical protein